MTHLLDGFLLLLVRVQDLEEALVNVWLRAEARLWTHRVARARHTGAQFACQHGDSVRHARLVADRP